MAPDAAATSVAPFCSGQALSKISLSNLAITKSRYEKSRYDKISLWKKYRYEKFSLWPRNLAMKKTRYGQKISLWKDLAMNAKSRYGKFSSWAKNLAMKKSRYEQISLWNFAMHKSRYENLAMEKSRYEISLCENGCENWCEKSFRQCENTLWDFFLKDFKHFWTPGGSATFFRMFFATALESPGGRFRDSFHASFHTNSRYGNLAIKSRYEISL